MSDQLIPALTLSYFFNKNLAVELFCCFAKHNIDGKGTLGTTAPNVGDTWIFPPALTLQYHFDPMAGWKPYVGVGAQYINFFDTNSNDLGGTMDIDDAFGFTLQAGVDIELGQGWYLNADVKKNWLDTSWTITGSPAGTPITGSFERRSRLSLQPGRHLRPPRRGGSVEVSESPTLSRRGWAYFRIN